MKMQTPKAPIPGANYTSDTRNYPWHRPSDITTYDEAVSNTLNRLETPSGASLVYSLLDIDMSIATVTSAMLQQAISKGVIHIDMAILIAGPVARGIEIFAKAHDLKYEMGAEANDELIYTPSQLSLLLEAEEDPDDTPIDEPTVAPPAPEEGLMASPSGDDVEAAPDMEQQSMLGMDEEETTDELA
jgi:hypothetical protein